MAPNGKKNTVGTRQYTREKIKTRSKILRETELLANSNSIENFESSSSSSSKQAAKESIVKNTRTNVNSDVSVNSECKLFLLFLMNYFAILIFFFIQTHNVKGIPVEQTKPRTNSFQVVSGTKHKNGQSQKKVSVMLIDRF